MYEIALRISNSIAFYWMLFHVVNWKWFWRNPPEFLPKPFGCQFCMMFWSGILATILQHFFLEIANYLFFVTLPLSVSYILILNKHE